jgi:hypothetical protein
VTVKRACVLTACLLLTAVGSVLGGTGVASAATADCADFKYDLMQVARPSSGASLVTRWQSEADFAEDFYGFSADLGDLAQVAGSSDTGLVAVNRLYKDRDFVWATAGADTDELVADGYQRQFVDFYAGTSDSSCVAPINRLKKGDIHRLATDTDTAVLVKDGWTKEKVAFYAETGEAESAPDPVTPPENGAPSSTDTKFTFAVLPDTQNEVERSTDPRFKNRATWLANNKATLDLRYAFQVGDLVDWGDAVPAQFTKASDEIKTLEAAVPWAPAVGNHDTAAVCIGGSACPNQNANLAVRDTTAFNAAFPVSRFENVGGTFEPNKIDNSYQRFSAGGVTWLALSLELWPRKAAIEWAKTVVASHPHDNVIVLTHHYLDPGGSISGSNGGYGATSPQYLYDQLIKVYPNIKFVLSGHVGDSAIRTDVGTNGNKIVSILQCMHSSTNPVRLLEIDTAAGTANSRVYAPYTDTDYPDWSTSTKDLSFVK